MNEIKISPRTEGMVDASADYYQESKVFHAIQNSQALEYDRIYTDNAELDLQLSPLTATWGLFYWEISLGIPPNPTGDYELRRPLVLSRLINEKNVGVDTLKDIAANYGENVDITIDHTTSTVIITFYKGIPPFIEEFKEVLENIIHAHFGIDYRFTYKSLGFLYVGTRATLAPVIITHPYTRGSYSTQSKTKVVSINKIAYSFIVSSGEEQ